MDSLSVNRMVEDFLRLNGFGGLCTDGCGCAVDDLAPCMYPSFDCIAAYKTICKGGEEFCAETCVSGPAAGHTCFRSFPGKDQK